MDRRTALPEGAVLLFPGMVCQIEKEIGRGSNAIVYKGHYEDAALKGQHHHVLVKELFPYHSEGKIDRSKENQTILCQKEAQTVWEMHEKSFMRGNAVHLQLLQKHPAEIGGNFNTFALNGTYYTILDFSGGRTLNTQENDGPPCLRQLVRRMMGMLDRLGIFHEMGFLHLDISPDNVLLINSGKWEQVELIDYNSITSLEEIEQNKALYFSAKSGYTAPEMRMHNSKKLGPWTDLYAAAAVFFDSLMHKKLSRMQVSGLEAIDVSKSLYLKDVPETVKSQVQQILKRGLATLPQRRYQTAEDMAQDFQELLDRIDGVGVTHWALWEMGRRSIQERVYENPAFQYLTDDKNLFPSKIETGEKEGFQAILQGKNHAVLTGSGGMGKTTFLLRWALEGSRIYRRDRPVILYISLYGNQPGSAHFIHDSLLRRLLFKPGTNSYADARHTLDQLLERPLKTASGNRPAVCLLLDGYNETTKDRKGLNQEIELLAGMEGVSLVIASRNELPEYPFPTWHMKPLEPEIVTRELSRHGLLKPESSAVQMLLQNPLMLSLFIRACSQSGEQTVIQTKEDLIGAYLNTLIQKETMDSARDSSEHFQIEAAVRCVYPMIAQLETMRCGSIPHEELLSAMEQLYGQLGRHHFLKLFPQWAGHSTEICGEARTGEAWYGRMVHDLLWHRLGLLYQDENGAYQVVHQEFRDTLAPQGKKILNMVLQRKRILAAYSLLALTALCMGTLLLSEGSKPYETDAALDVLKWGHAAFEAMNRQYTIMENLLNCEEPEIVEYDLGKYAGKNMFERAQMDLQQDSFLMVLGAAKDSTETAMAEQSEKLLETGEQMPWNQVSFLGDVYVEMGRMIQERKDRYSEYAKRLSLVYEGETKSAYQRCREMIQKIVKEDAHISALCFHLVCQRPEQGLLSWEGTMEGKAYRGTYQMLDIGRNFSSALHAFVQEEWMDESEEKMVSALNQARQEQRELRRKLLQDETYQHIKTR